MKECTKINELLSAYSDGEVAESERLFVENHLASCEECSAILEIYSEISNTVSSSNVVVPEALHIGVMNRVKYEHFVAKGSVVPEDKAKKRTRFNTILTRLAPVVACLAVVLVAWQLWGNWGNMWSADFAAEQVAPAAEMALDDMDMVAMAEPEMFDEAYIWSEEAAPDAAPTDDAEEDEALDNRGFNIYAVHDDEVLEEVDEMALIYMFRAEVLEFDADEWGFVEFEILLLVSNVTPIWDIEPGGMYLLIDNDFINVLDINGDPISHADIQPGMIVDIEFFGEIALSDPALISPSLIQIVG